MDVTRMAAFALLLPAVVAAAVVLVARFARGARAGAGWGAAGVGLATIAAQVAIARPATPPVDVTDRIPWLALAATLAAVVAGAWATRRGARAAIGAGVCLLTLGALLSPVALSGDLPRETIVWLAATVVVVLGAWANLAALGGADDPDAPTRALILTAAGSAVALILSGSAVAGQVALALTAALVAARLAFLKLSPSGAIAVGGAVLVAVVVVGFVYASLPASSALLLAAAPAAAWALRIGPARRLRPWARVTLGAIAVVLPVAGAVALAASSAVDSSGY